MRCEHASTCLRPTERALPTSACFRLRGHPFSKLTLFAATMTRDVPIGMLIVCILNKLASFDKGRPFNITPLTLALEGSWLYKESEVADDSPEGGSLSKLA
ncbi:hypothetical protein ABBQ32_012413 [Trebouxia sp. C0010 RCD-2024]